MIKFNIKAFYNNIQKDFDSAYKAVGVLESYAWGHRHSDTGEQTDEHLNIEILKINVKEIRTKLQFAMESNGLVKLLEQFNSEFIAFEKNVTVLDMAPYIGELYSPTLEFLTIYRDVLSSGIEIESKEGEEFEGERFRLESILKGTPKVLNDRGIEPRNEAQVKQEIYNILTLVFPDTVREIPIPKVTKAYRPDIGIPKLRTAIEYKFIDSLKDAKVCLGGVYEDMKGYAGSRDWKNFICVFYMTDHFYTEAQIEAEFKLSKVEANWKPMIIFGKGGRIAKESPKKSVKKKTV